MLFRSVNLFDKIKLKEINVNVLEEVEVIPLGEIVGVKLFTSGTLVVGTSSIEGDNGEIYKPYETTNIQEGDTIVAINGNIINNTLELVKAINETKGESIEITYIHNKQEFKEQITPIKSKDGGYKIGIWVRDSAAGVGTLTFYNEKTESFAQVNDTSQPLRKK